MHTPKRKEKQPVQTSYTRKNQFDQPMDFAYINNEINQAELHQPGNQPIARNLLSLPSFNYMLEQPTRGQINQQPIPSPQLSQAGSGSRNSNQSGKRSHGTSSRPSPMNTVSPSSMDSENSSQAKKRRY